MNRILIFLLLSCVLSLDLYSQKIKKFENDSVFIDVMKEFLQAVRKKEGGELISKFEGIYTTGAFSDEQKKDIRENCNRILSRNGQAFPHISKYLETMISFSESQQLETNYQEWEKYIESMFNNPKIYLQNIVEFFEYSDNLLKNNIIFKNASTKWVTQPVKYIFKVDTINNNFRIDFEQTTLTCFAVRDSMFIYETKGVFYPSTRMWHGQGATITWERSGFTRDSVYAKLQRYEIDMTKSAYTADSVEFFMSKYFNKPLFGEIEDMVQETKIKQSIFYPKFVTYGTIVELDDVIPGINYKGGFAINGSTVFGVGTKENMAWLQVKKGDTLLLTARSISFSLNKDPVVAYNTMITIPLEKDSIHHKSLLFKYFVDKKMIALIRNKKDISQMRYTDTYHNFEIDAEMLSWYIDSTEIFFKSLPGTVRTKARFRSVSFYSEDDFNRITLYDAISPISQLRLYQNKFKTDEFYMEEMARFTKYTQDQTHKMLVRLSYEGFIDYDIDKKFAKILPKTEHYILSRVNRKDYDIIDIESDTVASVPNAILDLTSKKLTVNGAEKFYLAMTERKRAAKILENGDTIFNSEVIPVEVAPKGKTLEVSKNREFEYDGEFKLGPFDFFGQDFKFEYEAFRMNLDNVDSLQVSLNDVDELGNPVPGRADVLQDIENIKGYVLLDKPNNKSGQAINKQFPMLKTTDSSYVFYDGPEQEVVYPREKFFFQIDTFSITGVYDYTTKDFNRPGSFKSGGIIPVIKEELVIVKDTVMIPNKDNSSKNAKEVASFGFRRTTGAEGIPLYGSKGTFLGDLKLSMKGLIGIGNVKYMTSISKSDNFIFYMDSMTSLTSDFYIASNKAPEYPSARGQKIWVYWEPYKDQMFATTRQNPFSMFDDEKFLADSVKLKGTLTLSPNGLNGNGLMEFENALLTSHKFNYLNTTFNADTADFKLKSLTAGSLSKTSFETYNAKTNIDLVGKIGNFEANDKKSSFGLFPQNQYICMQGKFTWFMDKKRVEMINSEPAFEMPADTATLSELQKEDLTLTGSKFISIKAGQDSLNFFSNSAVYDMEKSLITASNVKLIRVADATIYPSTDILIEEGAKMRTFENAKIIADNSNRFHHISNSTITILSRKDYNGSGTYDYVDYTKMVQKIKFDNIRVDSLHTVASGPIPPTQNFRLSPEFSFDGDVYLRADKRNLTFSGFTEIAHACQQFNIKSQKFKFTAEITPQEIYIPIPAEMFDQNRQDRIYSGIMMESERKTVIYPAFLSKAQTRFIPLLTADGVLYFDPKTQYYNISSREKVSDPFMPGNHIQLNKEFCNMKGEGRIDFGVDLDQVKLKSIGNMELVPATNKVNINTLLMVDFFFPSKAFNIMAEKFQLAVNMPGVDLSTERSKKILYDAAGKKETNKMLTDITSAGTFKVPDSLEHTIVFYDLNFEWDEKNTTYISKGQLGLGNIGKSAINKYTDGYVEIQKRRTGDIINIYLRINRENWFFFSYTNDVDGVMQSISSLDDFNNEVINVKEKKRRVKGKRDENSYAFYPSTNQYKNRFLRKYMGDKAIDDVQGNEQFIEQLPSGEQIDEKPEKEEIMLDSDKKKEEVKEKEQIKDTEQFAPEEENKADKGLFRKRKKDKEKDEDAIFDDENKQENKTEDKPKDKPEPEKKEPEKEKKKEENLRDHLFDDEENYDDKQNK